MFRRQQRRENRRQMAQQFDHEIVRLQTEVNRLEAALVDVIQASDDVLVDLRRAQLERAQSAKRATSGFADAWHNSDSGPSGFEEFFTAGEIDKRARRWLLSSS